MDDGRGGRQDKPKAYVGTEPYLFVSYSHKDENIIYPLIRKMQQRGVRIWYDEGIRAGHEFPQYIEEALINAACFVQFVSPNAVESFFCRNEIGLALDVKLNRTFVVYIEKTELKYGLRLQLRSIQALARNQYETEQEFLGAVQNLLCVNAPEVFEAEKSATLPNETKTAGQPATTLKVETPQELPLRNLGPEIRTVKFREGFASITKEACKEAASIREVVLPDTVRQIEKWAFYHCSGLEMISGLDGVEEVEDWSFESCEKLNGELLLQHVQKVGFRSFMGCRMLQKIQLPQIRIIANWAFAECTGLESVECGTKLTEIGEAAFYHCGRLNTIELRGPVRRIGEKAFCNCTQLRTAVLPDALEQIESSAFEGCSALVQIFLPCRLRKIGKNAFAGCTKLEEIKIPEGVREIDSWSFSGCRNLKKVVLPETMEVLRDGAFANCEKLAILQIPSGCRMEGRPVPSTCRIQRKRGQKKNGFFEFWSNRSGKA